MTGSTDRDSLEGYPFKPNRVVQSIADIDPEAVRVELMNQLVHA